METLTFYETYEYLDAPNYDIELYNVAGAMRRFSIYQPESPQNGSLFLQAIYHLERLPLAANYNGWKKRIITRRDEFVKEHPTVNLEPPLEELLASLPTEHGLFDLLSSLASEMKQSEALIIQYQEEIQAQYNSSQFAPIPHPPGEKSNFLFREATTTNGVQ